MRRLLNRLLPPSTLAWNRRSDAGGFTEDLHLCRDPRYYRRFCTVMGLFPIVRAGRGEIVFRRGPFA